MIDREASVYKDNIANIKINRNSEAWQRGYSNASQHIQAYSGVSMALSNLFGQGLANMEDQTYQAYGTEESAASQVESSTVQAMQQGVSQTQDVASQLRQSQSSVAQDMQSMVGSTKV